MFINCTYYVQNHTFYRNKILAHINFELNIFRYCTEKKEYNNGTIVTTSKIILHCHKTLAIKGFASYKEDYIDTLTLTTGSSK